MRIRKVMLRELGMRLIAPFETSNGVSYDRRILLVEADVDGVVGWAECVAGEAPHYGPETVETAWHVLRDHLWPLMRGKEFAAAAEASSPPGGSTAVTGPAAPAIVPPLSTVSPVSLWPLDIV